MSSPAVAEVRLSRSLVTRLFGGGNFQWLLTLVVALYLALVVVVATFAPGTALLALLASLVVAVPWLFGVTAGAHADADGVHWRYYRRRSYAWSQIEQLEFGAVRRAGASATSAVPAVRVRAEGAAHPVGPSVGVSTPRLTTFARELAALGREHGVASAVTSTGGYWDALERT